MGELIHCTLAIGGLIREGDLPQLVDAMISDGCEATREEALAALRAGVSTFEFPEANGAQFPSDLWDVLEALKMKCAWSCEAGEDFASCVEIKDFSTDTHVDYVLIDDQIALTVTEATDSMKLAAALRWSEFIKQLKPYVYGSNHDLLAKVHAGLIPTSVAAEASTSPSGDDKDA